MAKRNEAVRGRLSRDVIVACAIALADQEGLEAVTIRRLAQEQGVTPMAMYWHFSDKESLLDGIAESLVAAVKLPEPSDASWDTQLREILAAFLEAIRPHPAVAGLALRRILTSEPGLALAERALGLLRSAGFSAARAAEAGSFVLCAVITMVTSQPGRAGRTLEDEAREQMFREKRAALEALSPARYPNVVAAAPSLVGCTDDHEYYELNLDLLVQGIRGIQPA
ncbi:MAG TPA: TetR/AcrR family transcriptional regulator [Actinoplanes sp.]|jgi:TetR/AcrR family tetracycline transcriptional repressor|nr:TetR/AcrR family transcriptional regulator [Actinoplanes sp.]